MTYLELNDIVSDLGAPVRLWGCPGEVAMAGAPVQDVGSARLCWLVYGTILCTGCPIFLVRFSS